MKPEKRIRGPILVPVVAMVVLLLAVHTAAGFTALGMGILAFTWFE